MLYTAKITVVNPDACHRMPDIDRMMASWATVSTAGEIAEALARQTGYWHSGPGTSGRYVIGPLSGQFFVIGAGREDLDAGVHASGCTDDMLRPWGDDLNKWNGGESIFSGQIETIYVFDVDGTPLSLITKRQNASSRGDTAELQSIVDSMTVERG